MRKFWQGLAADTRLDLYNKDRAGPQGPKVFLLEISGYTEGDVIHMNQVPKEAQQIQVPLTVHRA